MIKKTNDASESKKRNRLFILILIGFIVAAVAFAILANVYNFHDTYEYISLMREFAGYGHGKAYTTHSLLYSIMAVPFLWVWKSLASIRLFNMGWVILTALLLWFYGKDKKAFLLWIFCPLAWIVGIQTTPILPATFFILAYYAAFRRWETNNTHIMLALSGISAGFAFTLYAPTIVFILPFFLISFYNKKMGNALLFLLYAAIPLLIGGITDFIITGIPFSSFISYFGTNLVVVIGKNPNTKFLHGILSLTRGTYLLLTFLISPLLFTIYKIDWKRFKQEAIVLVICLSFFIIRGGELKYFLFFVPIVLLLLANAIDYRKVMLSAVISILLIPLFCYGYFGHTNDYSIAQDMQAIYNDFKFEKALANPNLGLDFWGNTYFFWPEAYKMAQEGRTYFTKYSLESNPRIDLYKQIELQANLKRYKDINIKPDMPLIDYKDSKMKGFYPVKCYQMLCVYKPVNPEQA